MEDHLGTKPHDVFDAQVWATMLEEAGTFRELEARCAASIDALSDVPDAAESALEALECGDCGSSLMEATEPSSYYLAEFECRVCGDHRELCELIPAALQDAYAFEAYRSAKDGEEPPIGLCPNCIAEAFHRESDLCLVCGDSRPFEECERCGCRLGLDEQGSGLCGYCSHMADKIAAE